MAKVMLVEDDNNLREIYEARLAAEGYDIISAPDGEAALALAIKERPDLIISDIMMPKVSGFDMLDILRSTSETKNTKIIMMTALNQAEDKARAEKLGADMYLVKSQVTLEDVVRSAKTMLGEQTPLSIGGLPVEHPEPAPTQPDVSVNASSLDGNAPPVPATAAPQAIQELASPAVEVPATAAPSVPAPAPTPEPAPTQAQAAEEVPESSPAALPDSSIAPTPPTSISVSQAPAQPAAIQPEGMAEQPAPTATQTPQNTASSDSAQQSDSQTLASSLEQEEAALQAHIEQFIGDKPGEPPTPANPTTAQPQPSTSQLGATPEPAPAAPPPTTSAPVAKPPQPIAVPVAVAPPQPATTPPTSTPTPPPETQSSMAQPPSHMNGGEQEPQNSPMPDDRPAGEQVIVKSAPTGNGNVDNGIDAAISGRKKVIQPISDMLNSGPDLEALLAKESPQPAAAIPSLNAVVTPEGSTLSSKTGSPTMSDVIAPNPQAIQSNPNDPPPAPPVA